ncbi:MULTISPECIES: excinuclease ABC subunit UvrC [Thalassospira]|jgi:excinuclease ABC subunit C|uniref:excinuclease ABC subunit UvrC n=1 Tax=Thalassospira TaxID=168934 RepID=UPI000827D3CB|nr:MULTISPECIES: excinuclease ABC subunit UvrC [Thalassospira]MAB32846.1 excinuclease ABC subunit C [Thalassospira sp.]MDM7974784.1 excinuclease ABC subunit UvrC [Thalassospira xiamenensis]OCK06372.1 UvrABC system protein C [Thalassospira sp. KO164]SED67054.1 Excinuclease ABC subunit C [Thalassospira permensis]HBN49336.1 excinuclease ABC subunit C [Thalassospira sp.]|tara:strand:+ start:1230 stop:3149 length:1920 start_codon:yes stop_codon:yes gene_type:complete
MKPETPSENPAREIGLSLEGDDYDGGAARGVEAIKHALKTMPGSAGVYRMIDDKDRVLYVGKAKNLKKRVVAYTRLMQLPIRIARMVAQTVRMEIITTHTEAEALLLESNLIKKLKPRYNILLRDDKSFPYILITEDHDYPRIVKHRGARAKDGSCFGPFASAWAVNNTINHLQRAFLLRSCTDAVFSNRSRPCLLYQIKRCSAPCVDRVAKAEYDALVDICRDFLTGRSQKILKQLESDMLAASERMDFEQAAMYRDRIRALSQIRSHQDINLEGVEEADVIALHHEGGQSCVQVFFFRSGSNYGNRSYFPRHEQGAEIAEILSAFVGQFYADKPAPKQVLLSHEIEGQELVETALSINNNRKITLQVPKRGGRRKLVEHALTNAKDALGRRMAESASQRKLLEDLADKLELDGTPERIEVYDNSHIQGTNMVGGMIVAGPEGFMKSAYRKFNIKGDIAPGDDFAMMREVLTRRFARAQKEDPDRENGTWPDLCLIDGGLGQLGVAREVLEDLGIEDVMLVGVAKGVDRNAGKEVLHIPGKPPVRLDMQDPVLYFIQRLRDEAHRWAIGTHRAKRSKQIGKSVLDNVPGVGGARKKALLHHFGSARGVADAGLTDLEAVDGISAALARKIYDHFHDTE